MSAHKKSNKKTNGSRSGAAESTAARSSLSTTTSSSPYSPASSSMSTHSSSTVRPGRNGRGGGAGAAAAPSSPPPAATSAPDPYETCWSCRQSLLGPGVVGWSGYVRCANGCEEGWHFCMACEGRRRDPTGARECFECGGTGQQRCASCLGSLNPGMVRYPLEFCENEDHAP